MGTGRRLATNLAAVAGMVLIAPAAGATEVSLSGFPYTVARAGECAPVVDMQIEELGLTTDDVESVTLVHDELHHRRRDVRINRRYLGWVDLYSCVGYVVVDMNNRCRVRRVYTRGDCTLPSDAGIERAFWN